MHISHTVAREAQVTMETTAEKKTTGASIQPKTFHLRENIHLKSTWTWST